MLILFSKSCGCIKLLFFAWFVVLWFPNLDLFLRMQAGCVCFSAVAPALHSLGFYCVFDSNGVSYLVVRSSLLSIYYSPCLSDFIFKETSRTFGAGLVLFNVSFVIWKPESECYFKGFL